MSVFVALWKREIIKFVRDRSRLIGALAQPLVFWMLLGLGFQRSFNFPSETEASVAYLEYLFPGIVALMILFTAIFSTISIVEERKTGFLQAALIAPVSRISFVVGTTFGGTTLSLIQAGLLLLLLPVLGIVPSPAGLLLFVVITVLTGMAFTALGVAIAWIMESTRGFHAIMNLFLLPLWLLSGSFFSQRRRFHCLAMDYCLQSCLVRRERPPHCTVLPAAGRSRTPTVAYLSIGHYVVCDADRWRCGLDPSPADILTQVECYA